MAHRKDSRQGEREDPAWEATWADLRAAVARGEITREELLADVPCQPIRLTIGDCALEVNLRAFVREVPPPAPRPPAVVITFPEKRRA